jgi:hypothetical protein
MGRWTHGEQTQSAQHVFISDWSQTENCLNEWWSIYVGYPESNFRFHVEHELVGAARRGCTAV